MGREEGGEEGGRGGGGVCVGVGRVEGEEEEVKGGGERVMVSGVGSDGDCDNVNATTSGSQQRHVHGPCRGGRERAKDSLDMENGNACVEGASRCSVKFCCNLTGSAVRFAVNLVHDCY